MIYTSRYQNGAEIARVGLVPIGITAGAPRFALKCKLAGNLSALAPSRAWFGQSNFEELYRGKLDEQGPLAIAALIEKLSGGRNCVLLCYENVHGGENCHRTMFAQWWLEQTGEVVEEIADLAPWKPKKGTVAKKPKAQTAFDF